MEPLAPYERVFVDPAFLERDAAHGSLGCEFCHQGNPKAQDWQQAHAGLVKDPTYPDPSGTCGLCHAEIAERYGGSLHATLSPYVKTIEMRLTRTAQVREKVGHAMDRHCLTCHASCGECHVSRPKEVEGGLLASHQFKKRPPMQQTCTACHGSRIDREFFGKNEGIPADIHRMKNLQCVQCHGAEELHGDGGSYDNRYQVTAAPACIDCHGGIYQAGADNAAEHALHRDRVSCQVCHAMPYKNCSGCHVGTDSQGLAYFKTGPAVMDFKIGLNPQRSERRPERFAVLRRVPVDRGTFDAYVADAMGNFDALPTWKMATPHTIRRETPQNRSCDSCHGHPELFLRAEDVDPRHLEANRSVVVPPAEIPGRRQ